MSIALIGVIWLQAYWINNAIRLNEKQFDKSVFAALNRVSSRLQNNESYALLQIQQQQFHNDSITNKQLQFLQIMQLRRYQHELAIAERVNLEDLNQSLVQEIESAGVDIPFQYGVYDNISKSLVIANNHFLVEEGVAQASNVADQGLINLYNSTYRVQLYPEDHPSPGFLTVYFPGKSNVLWRTVWQMLLLAVACILIIMLCFGYTLSVIFQQKKLSEMKTDFINNMTHEFKTPIATISLATDAINNANVISHPDKVKRFTDIIKQENKRMNSQVEKVLQMAVLDKREFKLNLSDLSLHDVITQAVTHAALVVEQKDGTIHADLHAQHDVIEADLTHISNMIANLIDNANKYSPEKPHIVVSTRNVSGGVEVSVKDNGIGISKEARKHIFDKFYRVHTGNLHDIKGFGLGLSYVRAMMTAHKGHIDVKSELGKGSTFTLFFPFKIKG